MPPEKPTAVTQTPSICQNMRSAPQKQPRPNIAVSRPSGYGPFSGRLETKCFEAVGIGLPRPGSASSGFGRLSFLFSMSLRKNIAFLQACRPGYQSHCKVAGGPLRPPAD